MEIKYTTSAKSFERYANECLKGEEGAIIHSSDDNSVWVGQLESAYNQEAITERGLDVGQGQYFAGAIVNMPGDISVCITKSHLSDVGLDICDAVYNYLADKGIEVVKDGNDILAEGKKIASSCQVEMPNGYCQTVAHISIGKMDLELVKAICVKPMVKIPGALSEYGITAEDILPIIQNILEAL